MEIPSRLEDMVSMLGKSVYRLSISQMRAEEKGFYDYQITPFEMKVAEIRLGEARRGSEEDSYGPGFVTWLCKTEKGYCQAFSPIGDEILSNHIFAGMRIKGFLNKEDLLKEAEILKECVLQNYKSAASVEIRFGDFLKMDSLEEKIQKAEGKKSLPSNDEVGRSSQLTVDI